MISVVTTTFNTPADVLARTWASLKNQTHTDWEWLIYDDSTTDHVARQVYGFCSDERYTIRYLRPHVPSGGNIGYAKRTAFGAAFGLVLVELDHDDELMPDALHEIELAFQDPDIGFVWSDCAEILPDGQSGKYPSGWGLGYGSEYWHPEYQLWAMRVPMNRTTLSHIVSAPNHVRAWRATAYHLAGGHDPSLQVADDYDLIVRTAITTKCHHIPQMIYKQHIGPATAQRTKNALIQQLVPQLHARYSAQLDAVWGPLAENSTAE